MNKVKIISGKYRGRSLDFPSEAHLRPTLGRVREVMFAWLMPYIHNANCLDLFAGSGAMGFEAISRGAKSAFLVDSSPVAIEYIQKNRAKFSLNNLSCFCGNYLNSLYEVKAQSPYDIAFIDPPYLEYSIDEILIWLHNNEILQNKSLCICEWHLQNEIKLPKMFNFLKIKKASKTGFCLLQYDKSGELNGL